MSATGVLIPAGREDSASQWPSLTSSHATFLSDRRVWAGAESFGASLRAVIHALIDLADDSGAGWFISSAGSLTAR